MSTEVVEAGCTRCNQRFVLPVDEDGNPIWTHICPKRIEDQLEDLTKVVKKLADQLEQ